MTTLRGLWYIISLVFFPLRFVLHAIHRALVFLSKAGARWIIPLVMLAFGMLLRSQIDAFAGQSITGVFYDFPEPIFSFRIEVTFALIFMATFITLKIVSGIVAPIVGALPAPRAPMIPLKPLTAKKHEIVAQRAKLAVSAKRKGYFNGKLERFNKRLPANIQVLLRAETTAADRNKERKVLLAPSIEQAPAPRQAATQLRPRPPVRRPPPETAERHVGEPPVAPRRADLIEPPRQFGRPKRHPHSEEGSRRPPLDSGHPEQGRFRRPPASGGSDQGQGESLRGQPRGRNSTDDYDR